MADHFKLVFFNDNLQSVIPIDRVSILISLQIEHDELVPALRSLDNTVKSGPDQISLYFLRHCIPFLARPILLSFNRFSLYWHIPQSMEVTLYFPNI